MDLAQQTCEPQTVNGGGSRQSPSARRQMEGAALEQLAQACETVRQLCPDLPVLAIRWMHFKHPLHPVQEALLRSGGRNPAPPVSTQRLKEVVRCVLYGVYLSCRLASLHLVMRRQILVLKRQSFDIMAKTCCLGIDRAPDGRDFYYGDLQPRLSRRGVRVLLLCGNIFDESWIAFARSHTVASPGLCRLPELCLVHPLVPIRVMARQLASAWRLRHLANQRHDPLVRTVAAWASHDCLIPDTALTCLMFWIAKTAVQIWRPRAFLTFYEGHAWERCAWWGVKMADAACQTIGYQHTMLFRESSLLLSPPTEGPAWSQLDIALCLGQGPLELLRPGHAGVPTRMLRFGSFRYQEVTTVERPADPRRRTVLVTPEGLESEASALFAFASECARKLPSYTFILRMQPGVPLPETEKQMKRYLAHQPNLKVSDQPNIYDDYARASVLIYRGSSTVLYATLQGLLPVYLHIDSLVNTDPLYMLTRWRRICASPGDFSAIVQEYEGTSSEHREAEWQVAAEYLRRYVQPVGEDALDELLACLGFPARPCASPGP